jgi:hypothetical protein
MQKGKKKKKKLMRKRIEVHH